ncbi:MAG: cupin domain-containing protein, partial [Thermoanaerobaculia bacterium]
RLTFGFTIVLLAALPVLALAAEPANGNQPAAAGIMPEQQVKAGPPEQADPFGSHATYSPDELKWQDGPPALPRGAKVAVLEGDPREEGVFTVRLWFPDGFRIKPHWHPAPERVTVISGTFNLGRGDSFDTAKAKALPAGSFSWMPAEAAHFAWAKGDTVIPITGGGPWQVIYVDPRDDPRRSR